MSGKYLLQGDEVLLIVDIQNDFCPGGALPVPNGDEVVPVANRLSRIFPHIVITQDWHPRGHLSFASTHIGKKPYDVLDLPYGKQILWPDHCVQGSEGARLHGGLTISRCELIIRKGYHAEIDSYSTFYENDKITPTGLAGYLLERDLKKIFIIGLATDFCVLYSTLDARRLGFEVFVIEDGVRGIDVDNSLNKAWQSMSEAGAIRLKETDISLR